MRCKGLDGSEYELETPFLEKKEIKDHLPEQKIAVFHSLGLGTRLVMNDTYLDKTQGSIILVDSIGDAVVTDICNENGKYVIYAEEKTHKEEKIKFVEEIVRRIDLKQGLGKDTFISMLTNVFTKEQLFAMMNENNIEVLLFDGLMYLKVGLKAYRL